MAIQIGTVDGLINITEDKIRCFLRAIHTFSNGGVEYAINKNVSLGSAFQRFVEPVYTEKQQDFRFSDIEKPVYTKGGNEQSPARITFCRKMGLLNIEISSGVFELTPLAEELYKNKITIEEYAFILLSKQGIFLDGSYKQNLLSFIAEWFYENTLISENELKSAISAKYGDSNYIKTRADIIINALALTGLVTNVSSGVYVLSNIAYAEIFKDFKERSKNIQHSIKDDDAIYTNYMGSLDFGIFDILSLENINIYNSKYPNLVNYIKDVATNISSKSNEINIRDIEEIMTDNISLLTAIRTKPFLILGGFSGTGKSQKVKELAYLTCPKELQGEKSPGNYALISVKPNWHDSTELLGYESNIAHKYMVTDFMRFCVKAMQYPNVPFFCCLDEMNLAPVEEYFAEYLSVLESRKKNAEREIVSEPLVSASVFTKSYKGGDIFGELGMEMEEKMIGGVQSISYSGEALKVIESLQTNGLCLPQNLVVIGTVNMDDTTNSFSRKVIDRAMTFETDIERFSDIDYFNAENTLQYGNVDGSMFICDEVRSDEAIAGGFEVTLDEQMQFINFIDGINDAMNGTSFQVSYRVMNEAVLYYRAMKLLNKDVEVNLHQVFNDILLMKVLPRIEGDSQAKKALEGLAEYMTGEDANLGDLHEDESPWKKSYVKVKEMIALLNEGDGFTRFWK